MLSTYPLPSRIPRAICVISGDCPANMPSIINIPTALNRLSGSSSRSGSINAPAAAANSSTGKSPIACSCVMLIIVLLSGLVLFHILTLPDVAELLNPLLTCGQSPEKDGYHHLVVV